jgi:hypothetical protein
MKTRCAVLLLATLSLGGCCLSGSGCNAPIEAATTMPNPDGLAQPPAAEPPSPAPKQRVSSRRKSQGNEPSAMYGNSDAGDNVEDDEARLRRKLIICQGCAVSGN